MLNQSMTDGPSGGIIMTATPDENIRRLPNGVINSQYYLERGRSVRAAAWSSAFHHLRSWLKKLMIRVIHTIEVIAQRHKTHNRCEQ